MNEQDLSRAITDAVRVVYMQTGGPGLEARDYREALAFELRKRGMTAERVDVPAGKYPGVELRKPETIDMIVNDRVIVAVYAESKGLKPAVEAKVLGHLRISYLKLALIVNFGVENVKQAVRRVVNTEV